MPRAAISIATGRMCHFSILSLALPGQPGQPVGVLLFDPKDNDLQFKLRDDWEAIGVDEDDQEYVAALDIDFQLRLREVGGEAFLLALEDSLSGLLRISDREPIAVTNSSRTLQRLFDEHVDSQIQ